MSVRSRILAARDQALRRGLTPTRLLLPLADETALEIELAAESYHLAQAIRQHGLRKTMPRIYELQIVWSSARFAVE